MVALDVVCLLLSLFSHVVLASNPIGPTHVWQGIARDGGFVRDPSTGCLYVTDHASRVIRMDPYGTYQHEYTTTNPQIKYPTGVAIDQHTNVYTVDPTNSRLVRWSFDGVVNLVIPNILNATDVIIVNNTIYILQLPYIGKYDLQGRLIKIIDLKIMNALSLNVAENTGDIYLHDFQNSRVIRYNSDGIQQQFYPYDTTWVNDVRVDPYGDIYIATSRELAIMKYDGKTGQLLYEYRCPSNSRCSGFSPDLISIDPLTCDVYVTMQLSVHTLSPTSSFVIIHFNANGSMHDITTTQYPQINDPMNIVAIGNDTGVIYVLNSIQDNTEILQLTTNGSLLQLWEYPGSIPPTSLAIGVDGDIYICNYGTITKISKDGKKTQDFSISNMQKCVSITIDHQYQILYMVDQISEVVITVAMDVNGNPTGVPHWLKLTPPLASPTSIALDLNHNLIISQYLQLVKYDLNGTQILTFHPPSFQVLSIDVDSLNRIYVTYDQYDLENKTGVMQLSSNGEMIREMSAPNMGKARGIAVDMAGTVYVSDTPNSRILVFASDHEPTHIMSGVGM